MKNITVNGTSITTSKLGFGCAGLMRLTSPVERQRILGSAFDHGVRHYDTARMYGLGKAESVLGEFIRTRRAEVTVTSKFGIQLNPYASRLGNVQSIFRRIIGIHPTVRRFVRRRSEALYQSKAFTPEDARTSLEISLKELSTDYIDIYLMHECKIDSVMNDDLLSILEKFVQDGKIRSYGIATTFESSMEICQQAPKYTKIVQFGSDIINRNLSQLSNSGSYGIITHSGLSSALDIVSNLFQADTRLLAHASELTGMDCSIRQNLSSVLLNYSVLSNPYGITLFHSNTEKHIVGNISSIDQQCISYAAVMKVADLIVEAITDHSLTNS